MQILTPRKVARKKTEERRQEMDGFSVCSKHKKEPCIYSEIIAVEGLKKIGKQQQLWQQQ